MSSVEILGMLNGGRGFFGCITNLGFYSFVDYWFPVHTLTSCAYSMGTSGANADRFRFSFFACRSNEVGVSVSCRFRFPYCRKSLFCCLSYRFVCIGCVFINIIPSTILVLPPSLEFPRCRSGGDPQCGRSVKPGNFEPGCVASFVTG